jgi:hypothetical protein
MSKPWSKVSRLTFHRQQVRKTKRGSKARLVAAWNFFTAMAAAAEPTVPGATKTAIETAHDELIKQAEALAARVPAERLERGGARR